MVLMPASFVGYHVFREDLEHYRIHEHLPKNDRRLVYDIGSKIGLNLWLVHIEVLEDGSLPTVLYLCCFAVHDPRPYDANAFSAIPLPPDFPKITEVIPVEEVDNNPKLYKLFEPYTLIASPPSAKRILDYESEFWWNSSCGARTWFAILGTSESSLSRTPHLFSGQYLITALSMLVGRGVYSLRSCQHHTPFSLTLTYGLDFRHNARERGSRFWRSFAHPNGFVSSLSHSTKAQGRRGGHPCLVGKYHHRLVDRIEWELVRAAQKLFD